MSIKKKAGFIYSPNSIHHGLKLYSGNRPSLSREAILTMQVARLDDFLEFLFDHSEHCDHISYGDAWKEFEIFEAKDSHSAQRVREHRKKMREGKLKYDPTVRMFVNK